jgi:hypothetical protein
MAAHFTKNIKLPDSRTCKETTAESFDQFLSKRRQDRDDDHQAKNGGSQVPRGGPVNDDFHIYDSDQMMNEETRREEERKNFLAFEGKVNRILYQIEVNPKQRTDMKSEDPLVLLEVAKRLYGEIREENANMIKDMNLYLNAARKRSHSSEGTTAAMELERCLMFFKPVDVAAQAPNPLLTEESMIEFYKTFNDAERGVIANLDKAQHELVLKAVTIARDFKPLAKEIATMTTETCVGLDIKLTHNWSEGRKKGELDAQEEFKKRFDKGDSLQDELNREIKNSKLEKMLLTDQIVKVEDEVVKLHKKIKDFDFIKEKLDIDIKDMDLNGKNMEKKLESTEKEMKRLIEVNRRYANDAQRLLVFGEDTIKKFVDDNWFNERIEKRRDKDVFKCIKNC